MIQRARTVVKSNVWLLAVVSTMEHIGKHGTSNALVSAQAWRAALDRREPMRGPAEKCGAALKYRLTVARRAPRQHNP